MVKDSRKIAAILAADVVEYSRLMGADEEGTLAALNMRRALFDELVKLADKICNLRDLLASPPSGWSLERRREYFDWAEDVLDQVRGTNARLERKFDQLCRKKPSL